MFGIVWVLDRFLLLVDLFIFSPPLFSSSCVQFYKEALRFLCVLSTAFGLDYWLLCAENVEETCSFPRNATKRTWFALDAKQNCQV